MGKAMRRPSRPDDPIFSEGFTLIGLPAPPWLKREEADPAAETTDEDEEPEEPGRGD